MPRATSRRGRRAHGAASAAASRSRAASPATRAGSPGCRARPRSRRRPTGASSSPQQGGALRVVKNGALLATPFATVHGRSSGERGLIGVALHPELREQRLRLRLLHRDRRRRAQPHQPLHRRRRRRRRRQRDRAGRPAATCRARPTTTAAPCTSAATASSTSASATTPTRALAQDLDESVRQDAALQRRRHASRRDNPFFATQSGLARAIWAYGLRNPFTFAVQPGTGRIHINDVGQNTWEEINLGAPGANYGWPGSEGPRQRRRPASPRRCSPTSTATPARPAPGRAASSPASRSPAARSIRRAAPSPRATASSYYFADYVSELRRPARPRQRQRGVRVRQPRRLAGRPAGGGDGALYVLTRGGIDRISAP